MRTALLLTASIALFLAAAKAHGRQLRLEREATGVMHVVFGGENPPVVEAIWRAERIRFWIATPSLALVIALACWMLAAPAAFIALGVLAWAPSLAFAALGIASALRVESTHRGSTSAALGWWSLVAVTALAVIASARAAVRTRVG